MLTRARQAECLTNPSAKSVTQCSFYFIPSGRLLVLVKSICLYICSILWFLTGNFTLAATDPYAWLEDIEGEESLQWVSQENRLTEAMWTNARDFSALSKKLQAIYDSKERLPLATLEGEFFYNYWRDENNPRGVWRRTPKAEYHKSDPLWETVLNMDELASREDENWVFKRAIFLKPSYTKCLLLLSRGGADAVVVREFDLIGKRFVSDGFFLPESKTVVAWADPDSLLVATDFGPGTMTQAGYPRLLKRWQRGQTLTQTPVVFEVSADTVGVWAWVDSTPGFEREVVFRSNDFYSSDVFLLQGETPVPIKVPADATIRIHRKWLFIQLSSDWVTQGEHYSAGSLLVTEFAKFVAGNASLSMLYEPVAGSSLQQFVPILDSVLINELSNVRSRVTVASHNGKQWNLGAATQPGEIGTTWLSAIDAQQSREYTIQKTNYILPPTLQLKEIGSNSVGFTKSTMPLFDAEDLQVTQHWVESKDGTQVPYFQVGTRNPQKRPTLLYGYGGFGSSQLPQYSPHIGAAWLEPGGVYVVANIRGGGEFGPEWHKTAIREHRHRAFEDFIAVAEDLVARGVTTPDQLAAIGSSNGGLLVGNMLTMRPDLFGAIICQIPLLDMRRYHKLLAGASWMAEYGNPDDAADWKFIRRFSPYHNIKKGTTYPPVLFVSSTRDDRVHPGHARKMAAKMKQFDQEVYYYETADGGHGGAVSNAQRGYRSAIGFSFLWQTLSARPEDS